MSIAVCHVSKLLVSTESKRHESPPVRPICTSEAPMSSGSFHGMNGVCLPKVEGNGDLLGWYLSFVLHVCIVFCCVYCSVLDVSEDMGISNTISNTKHVAKNCLAFPSVSQLCLCQLQEPPKQSASWAGFLSNTTNKNTKFRVSSDILRLHRTTS